MSPRTTTGRFLGLALASALLLFGGVIVNPQAAVADTWDPVTGTGSTWSQNALDQWRKNVETNYSMTINYSGVGSSAGRRDFIQGSVDFAISEIPFQSAPEDGSVPERPQAGFAYMPIVAGGTAFMYNLKIGGKRVTNLRLGGETITNIFTGAITNWNDPRIASDNPGLTMPDKQIVPVVRSDGSGSTAQFTLWMSKQYPSVWNAFCASVGRPSPCGLTSQYPTFGNAKAQNGSLGVAGYVSQDYGEGAITYVEYSYALKSGFPVAKVLNKSGYYIEPTAPAVAVALMNAQIITSQGSADYLTQILDGVYNSDDSRSYPLSSYSYMIVPTEVAGIFTPKKGATLGTFASYVLCEGQQSAAKLGYSPLPMNLVLAGFEQIKRIPGADKTPTDPNKCNNPTFKPGDSPANNQLAAGAPMPPDCDKVGKTQCVTGTGGAADTPTGPGGSDSAVGAGNGAEGEYDANGALIGGSGGNRGGAVASPFSLPESGFGVQQALMTFSGVLLVLLIVLPPLFSRRLKRGDTAARK